VVYVYVYELPVMMSEKSDDVLECIGLIDSVSSVVKLNS
jgi:hypothetical protein